MVVWMSDHQPKKPSWDCDTGAARKVSLRDPLSVTADDTSRAGPPSALRYG